MFKMDLIIIEYDSPDGTRARRQFLVADRGSAQAFLLHQFEAGANPTMFRPSGDSWTVDFDGLNLDKNPSLFMRCFGIEGRRISEIDPNELPAMLDRARARHEHESGP